MLTDDEWTNVRPREDGAWIGMHATCGFEHVKIGPPYPLSSKDEMICPPDRPAFWRAVHEADRKSSENRAAARSSKR